MAGKPQPLHRRFWSKVLFSDNCWVWRASASKAGYGTFGLEGKIRYAHRVAWFLCYGDWPQGILCHTCDNRLCVRPSHTYEGTHKTNGRDRSLRGPRISSVSEWDRQRILFLGQRGWTHRRVARLVGLSQPFVTRVINGERLVPKQYESMRDEFKREGMGDKAAKQKAARIYNAKRKAGQKPVTRKRHGKKK